MNPNDKLILPFIFMGTVFLAALFTYNVHDVFPLWIVMMMILVTSFVIGSGYIRYLVEPLEQRSNELELLSRQTLHELNLPVASISANTQMLLKKEKDPKNIKRLERINQAAKTLEVMYKELDYTIKKQIHKVELDVCDLKDLVEQRVELYKELFPQISFSADLESSSVKIDTIGFLKVLDNLSHNAVKYSQPDSLVKLYLKNMQLTIEDEGIGMEDDFYLQAFEHYYQEDKGNTGQGLGLGVVKEYCDRNKIQIYVDSKKGRGTKITLDFNHLSEKTKKV